MTNRIDFDMSIAGITCVTFVGEVTDSQFADYLERMAANFDSAEKRVKILDATRAGNVPASQRRMQAQWMREYSTQILAFTPLTIFVIDSPLVKGVLTAIFWLQPLPTPYLVVRNLATALVRAQAQIATSERPEALTSTECC